MISEHPTGLLDTSVVIALETYPAHVLPERPLISAVTLAELSAGPLLTDDPWERAARQARLQQVEAGFDPLPFDAAAARAFGRVRLALHTSGKGLKARALDAMIAATALSLELPLFTANPRDIPEMEGLTVVSLGPGSAV